MSQKDKGYSQQTKPPGLLKQKQLSFIEVGVAALFGNHSPCPSGSY